MKKLVGIMLTILMALGLATSALAGDLKISGDMKTYSDFAENDSIENPDHSVRIRVRFHQDVNEDWSWRFRIRNTWDSKEASTTLDEAYLMYKFNNNRLDFGRYNAVWDQDHSYFATAWNSSWQDRNTYGVALNTKINSNFSTVASVFMTDTDGSKDSNVNYGLKGTYKNEDLTLSGSFFSKAKDANDFLVQAVYNVNDMFSVYGAGNIHNDDNSVDYNSFSLGASCKANNFLIYVDHRLTDPDGGDKRNDTALGIRYSIWNKAYLYSEYLMQEGDDNNKLTIGFNAEF